MNGQASIKFNQQMNKNINISQFDQTNTLIYVQPQDNRDMDAGFNSSKLNLSWEIVSYHNDVM